MLTPQQGEDPNDTLERLTEQEESASRDRAIAERNRRIADALVALNSAYTEADINYEVIAEQAGVTIEEARAMHRYVELTDEDGLQITLFDHQASISFPYWDSLDPVHLAREIGKAANVIAEERPAIVRPARRVRPRVSQRCAARDRRRRTPGQGAPDVVAAVVRALMELTAPPPGSYLRCPAGCSMMAAPARMRRSLGHRRRASGPERHAVHRASESSGSGGAAGTSVLMVRHGRRRRGGHVVVPLRGTRGFARDRRGGPQRGARPSGPGEPDDAARGGADRPRAVRDPQSRGQAAREAEDGRSGS